MRAWRLRAVLSIGWPVRPGPARMAWYAIMESCLAIDHLMKIPHGLQPLIEDGVIDAVVRPLKSGKEASVYVVRSGERELCAKVYKNMAHRSFQARTQYQEGRKFRDSRQARAIAKSSRFGRRERHHSSHLVPGTGQQLDRP